MLRLPPTAISLTITEVKDYERRHRFKKYLTNDDIFGQLAFRPKVQSKQKNKEPEHCGLEHKHEMVTTRSSKPMESSEDQKLLTYPPRRLPKSMDSANSGVPDGSSSSQTQTTNQSVGLQSTEDAGWQIALPPPFSLERRVVSDIQTLPSGRGGASLETPRGDIRPEPPITPTRQVPLEESAGSTPNKPPQSGSTGARIFSSAIRFVESIVRFPRHNSPTPSDRKTSVESTSQGGRDISGTLVADRSSYRIYDDSLPASLQPQTPLNLREARHRSRLYGFYTVPARPILTRGRIQPFIARPSYQEASGPPGPHESTDSTNDTMLQNDLSREDREASSGHLDG
ncbi:hypothetical protein F4777DRAFT_576297 [Nemania sp. FL0916]|nr:hypothetical protein F4777DRAFT_576297 [Nemania sp. FL0916]